MLRTISQQLNVWSIKIHFFHGVRIIRQEELPRIRLVEEEICKGSMSASTGTELKRWSRACRRSDTDEVARSWSGASWKCRKLESEFDIGVIITREGKGW